MKRRPYARFTPLPGPEWKPAGLQLSLVERAIVGVVQNRIARHEPEMFMDELAAEVGVARSTLNAAVARLVEHRILAVRRGNGRGARSHFAWGEALRNPEPFQPEKGSDSRSHSDPESLRQTPPKGSENRNHVERECQATKAAPFGAAHREVLW